jgi:hypothetical protein
MTTKTRPIVRLTGFLLGGLLAAALLLSGRMPASRAEAGARLTIDARTTAELGVSPAGQRLLTARNLHSGGPGARGALTLSRYARGTRSVRLRASSDERSLDEHVWLEIRAAGKRAFRGRLADLRRWTPVAFRLSMGETRRIELRASIPPSVGDGYRGRSTELTLEWSSRKASE